MCARIWHPKGVFKVSARLLVNVKKIVVSKIHNITIKNMPEYGIQKAFSKWMRGSLSNRFASSFTCLWVIYIGVYTGSLWGCIFIHIGVYVGSLWSYIDR